MHDRLYKDFRKVLARRSLSKELKKANIEYLKEYLPELRNAGCQARLLAHDLSR